MTCRLRQDCCELFVVVAAAVVVVVVVAVVAAAVVVVVVVAVAAEVGRLVVCLQYLPNFVGYLKNYHIYLNLLLKHRFFLDNLIKITC